MGIQCSTLGFHRLSGRRTIPGPFLASGGMFQGLVEPSEELGAGDLSGAEAQEVRAGHLAIDQGNVELVQVLDQGREGDLRGVGPCENIDSPKKQRPIRRP